MNNYNLILVIIGVTFLILTIWIGIRGESNIWISVAIVVLFMCLRVYLPIAIVLRNMIDP